MKTAMGAGAEGGKPDGHIAGGRLQTSVEVVTQASLVLLLGSQTGFLYPLMKWGKAQVPLSLGLFFILINSS